jgi:hypothetical protein
MSYDNALQISAKNLGELAMGGFCPRCFWLKLHTKKLPFQIFPGIFSSIDSYTKHVMHSAFDVHGCAPAWLGELGEVVGYRPPPHYSKYRIYDEDSGVMLTGAPDGILVLADGSHVIVDYKTARLTSGQDSLHPIYKTQLNGYAYIGERCGFSPVSGLALIYFEPVTHEEAAIHNHREDGFNMCFKASIVRVEMEADSVLGLMRRARQIYDMPDPPAGNDGCENCRLLGELARLMLD